jgi:benzoyl-CoA reductase/2-hydroxyglutaryl-CoA dehydratase subunit BcrC/BadD/HgdB
VARQFEDIFYKIEDDLGVQVTQSKIEEIFENVNKTYANFREIGQLMRHRPAPATEDVYLSAWMFTFLLGSKEAVEISQDMIDKIKENIKNKNFPVPDEKYRILIQGFAWIDNPIADWIRAHEDVSVIWNGFEYSSPYAFYNIEPLNPNDPFKSLANLMVQNALQVRTPELLAEAQHFSLMENGIDGVITTMPWACMVGGGAYPSHKNFMARKNLPYLDLGVDCYDKREFNSERVRKDVELFLSTILKKKPDNVTAA